jgi:hypothetical protein
MTHITYSSTSYVMINDNNNLSSSTGTFSSLYIAKQKFENLNSSSLLHEGLLVDDYKRQRKSLYEIFNSITLALTVCLSRSFGF